LIDEASPKTSTPDRPRIAFHRRNAKTARRLGAPTTDRFQ
jgi:hypothetical protein